MTECLGGVGSDESQSPVIHISSPGFGEAALYKDMAAQPVDPAFTPKQFRQFLRI